MERSTTEPEAARVSLTMPPASGPAATGRLRDVVLILALIGCVVGIAAHAPSTTYTYAQIQQVGANVAVSNGGHWLLPRDQLGGLARKPQLYTWLDAALLWATGQYDDWAFRLPTVLAALAMGVVLYVLALRWYDRRTALISACLWAAIFHLAKMSYVALTDMMFTLWVTLSISCADLLLFHRARSHRAAWAVGLWATMILGAMTKGWGVANLAIVGMTLALAAALWGGFGQTRRARGLRRVGACARLVLLRWWRAAREAKLGWGLLAMAVVLVPVWWLMFRAGGAEFRKIAYYEIVARVTGEGGDVVRRAPHEASAPPIFHLLYHGLPASLFALGAVTLMLLRRKVPHAESTRLGAAWLSARSPVLLPLCWVAGVVVPFSIPHGFRHDYLLPCYAAVAMLGAWGVEEVRRRGPAGGPVVSVIRHAFAALALVLALLLVLTPALLWLHPWLPQFLSRIAPVPKMAEPETWGVFLGLIPVGLACFFLAIRFSLRWQITRLVVVVVVCSLGVMFLDRHAIARQARTGDGERMRRFGLKVRGQIGDDLFAVADAYKLATELYVGRFGYSLNTPDRQVELPLPDPQIAALSPVAQMAWAQIDWLRQRTDIPWLVTCDKYLVKVGAAVEDKSAPYVLEFESPAVEAPAGDGDDSMKRRFRTRPELLGHVEIVTEPVTSQRWGCMYLIRVDRAKLDAYIEQRIYEDARWPQFASGKTEDRPW